MVDSTHVHQVGPCSGQPPGLKAQVLHRYKAVVTVIIVGLMLGAVSNVTSVQPRSTAPALATTSAGSAAAIRALHQALVAGGPRPFVPLIRPVGPDASGFPRTLGLNWAGYVDDNSKGNTYSTVAGSWVEPAITCDRTEDETAVYWVGLDGFSSPTVEQDGTLAWCYAGRRYYYSWWEMFPGSIETVGTTVAPGDRITASVRFNGSSYVLKVTDSTRQTNSFVTTQTCSGGEPCTDADAEWIAETPSGARGMWPWPPFGAWRLTAARVTSATTVGNITSFPATQMVIVGTDGGLLARTSRLGRSGGSFDVDWTHSY